MKTWLKRPLLTGALLLALAACNGGGTSSGGGGTDSGAADIQTSVPTPSYGAELKAEFDRINAVRRELGLGLLAQSAQLDAGAADHLGYLYQNTGAAYQIALDLSGQVFPETAGSPGFTGTTEQERCSHSGYAGQCAPGAIRYLHGGWDNGVIAAPYYALAALGQGEREIGLGIGTIATTCFTGCDGAIEIQPGRPAGRPPQRQAPGFLIATYLWGAFHVHVNEGETLVVERFEVRNTAGELLGGQMLTRASDPAGRVPGHAAMLIPDHPLTCGSAYTVSFAGTRDGRPFSAEWTDNACSDRSPDTEPGYQIDRDIVSTGLTIDLASREAVADIRVAPSEQIGLTLNVGDLEILEVSDGNLPLNYRLLDADYRPDTPGQRIDIAMGPGERAVIRYRFSPHGQFDGWSEAGYTFTWPYHCDKLFPCERSPVDGTRFSLSVTGLAPGQQAIYPTQLDTAPAYQLGWAVADYRWLELGTTPAGTRVRAAYLAGHEAAAQAGTGRLRDVFAWYEASLGAYPWGSEAASVEVDWSGNAYGGMEHHPYWHVETGNFGDLLAHAHEAAHGWYGNGVRLACWEDLVLSEGTASYLAAAAIGAILGASREHDVWVGYEQGLASQVSLGDHSAWPAGCSADFDVMTIYDVIPYYRGAIFFRSVENIVGRPALLGVLRRFFEAHRLQAVRFSDLLDAIKADTGYDPHPLAWQYLNRFYGGDFS